MDMNTLWTNDNLCVLNGMNSESVDLIYLDPPFNSKRIYSAPIGSKAAGAQFDDIWTWKDVDEACLERMVSNYRALTQYISSIGVIHSKGMMSYITFMTQRLIEMHRVLKPTGSIYLHCDPTASHYLKVVMDMIFGKDNFRNEIVWRIGWISGYKSQKRGWIRNHDIILYYTKTNDAAKHFVKELIPYPTNYVRRDGKKPTGKGIPVEDTWNCSPADVLDSIMIKSFSKEKTGYPTQKPLALLNRIITASSKEGDLVLDPFCGCATTCVAAEYLGRRWIGIDIEEEARKLVIDRLSNVGAGELFSDFVHRTDTPQRTDVRIEGPKSKGIKNRLYAEQKGACKACNGKQEARNLEVDHVIPSSKGGGDYYENYQLLCPSCNRIKGNRPMEYLRTRLATLESVGHKITFGQ